MKLEKQNAIDPTFVTKSETPYRPSRLLLTFSRGYYIELTNARWQLQCQRKRHLKIYLCLLLLRNYLNSLLINFYTNDKLPRIQIGKSGVQVKKENETFTVLCSRSLQNLEFGHFTMFSLQNTAEKCTKTCNPRAELLFLLIKPFVLWRCRCCRRS